MKLWNSMRSTFLTALHHPRLWLLQFFGNAAIVLLFVSWLHIPESHWLYLFFQFVVVLLIVVGALLLHGGTLNYHSDLFADPKATLGAALWRAIKHLHAFAIWAAIFYVVLHYVDKLDDYQYAFPGYLRSEFPAWLRRLISENAMDNGYERFIICLRWIVVPGLLLPVGLLCADVGLKGFARLQAWWRSLGKLPYWIVLILAALIGVYLPGKIMHWKLHSEGPAVAKEEIWLGFRMLIAYVLVIFSWLWVCAMLPRSRFRPDRETASQKAAA